MKEAEWLASDDAGKLVRFLASPKHRRRLRLLSCGACRYYQLLSPHERVRQALDCAEEFADGRLRESTLAGWQRMLLKRARESTRPIDQAIYAAVEHACLPPSSSGYCQDSWGHLTAYFRFHRKEEARAIEVEQMALTLLRDIFGNPFRPVAIDPRWLAFQEGLVVRLAQSAYDERDPSDGTLDPARLAILADAKEEAHLGSPQKCSKMLENAGNPALSAWRHSGQNPVESRRINSTLLHREHFPLLPSLLSGF